MKRKHPKSSITWLNRRYFLIENIMDEHGLKNSLKIIKSISYVQQTRRNFYGIARKSTEGCCYKVPRINVLLWPTSIKNIKMATIFTPKKKLLVNSYYLKQDEWLKEHKKLERFYTNKEKR